MKFNEAFDKAFEREKNRLAEQGEKFAIESKTAKILAFFWNIVAIADGEFDDLVHIDKNNNIISRPVPPTAKEPKEKKEKGDKSKPSDNKPIVPEGGDGSDKASS